MISRISRRARWVAGGGLAVFLALVGAATASRTGIMPFRWADQFGGQRATPEITKVSPSLDPLPHVSGAGPNSYVMGFECLPGELISSLHGDYGSSAGGVQDPLKAVVSYLESAHPNLANLPFVASHLDADSAVYEARIEGKKQVSLVVARVKTGWRISAFAACNELAMGRR